MSARQSHRRLAAGIKLADVLVKTFTSVLGPPGTFIGELAGKGFDAVIDRLDADEGKVARQIANIADSITTSALAPYEFISIEPNDLNAAAEAVADTISALPLDGRLLRESGYTALGLARFYRANAGNILEKALLGEAESAYDHILESVSHQVLGVVRASPEVHATALADLNDRLTALGRKLADPGGLYREAQGAALDDYLLTYRLHAADELFARKFVTIGAQRRSLRAGLAYVERRVVGPIATAGLEALLKQGSRILINADPGQGKTTFLRQAFVQLLTRSSANPIPLYIDVKGLAEFPADLDAAIKSINKWLPPGPSGWVDKAIRDGHALVLLDAVDDLLANNDKRFANEDDLDGFLAMAGHSTVVLTARSGTLSSGWVERHGFVVGTLDQPTNQQVIDQVRRWHEAVAADCPSAEMQDFVAARGAEMILALGQLSDLRSLGRHPLLCALMCETFLDSSYALPHDWIPLVRKVMDRLGDMDYRSDDPLMCHRDAIRDVRQEVAVWSVHNGPQLDPDHLADAVTVLVGENAADIIERILLRGTFLRRGPGGVFFINDCARDHLAADDLMLHGNIGLLREKARNLLEPRLIVAAAGNGNPKRANELINGLLDDAAGNPEIADALTVIASCGANAALSLNPSTRLRAADAALELVRRGDTSWIQHGAIAPLALDMLVRMTEATAPHANAITMASQLATQLGESGQVVDKVIIQDASLKLLASTGDLGPEGATAAAGEVMSGDESNGRD